MTYSRGFPWHGPVPLGCNCKICNPGNCSAWHGRREQVSNPYVYEGRERENVRTTSLESYHHIGGGYANYASSTRDDARFGLSTVESMLISTFNRQLGAVSPYHAVIELDVPKSLEQVTIPSKTSAKPVAGTMKKNQKRASKEREKALAEETKRERKREIQAEKMERRVEKRLRKRESRYGKKDESSEDDTDKDGHEEDQVEPNRRHERSDGKSQEEKDAKNILWIVIENL